MSGARTRLFRAAFAALHHSGANRALRGWARGLGLILTLHHVRPFSGNAFAPNRLLEVEPEFLDRTLGRAQKLGFEFVTLDEAWRRVTAGASARPFLHLTFDDGYRDVRDHALPIMESYKAPATIYVASGFADGEAELWWLALEEAIARARRVTFDLGAGDVVLPTATVAEKYAAWNAIYWRLRAGSEETLRAEVRRLAADHGVDVGGFARDLCMRWDELARFSTSRLVQIGAHTVSHPMLAKHPEHVVLDEMEGCSEAIGRKLRIEPVHFAYPVGDRSAAGPRDYALAGAFGFRTAVTTRPGHLTAAHARAPMALPRVSLNGNFQTLAAIDGLLSGTPFWAMRTLRPGAAA